MKKIISLVLVLFCSYISLGQSVYSWNSTNQKYKNLSQETIFVHYNTSLLFAGEYLYYKVYCINTNTSNLSNISRIAYVELISSEGENVFKHKIELIESEGYSDFFIPTSVPSGNYKLLAYTQWMKNLGGVENFFQADVSIINPYRGDQAAITFDDSGKNLVSQESFPKKIANRTNESDRNTTGLKLHLDKRKFGRREQVSLTLKSLKSTLGFGKYSVSVKRLDPIPVDLVERSTEHSFSKSAKEYPRGIVYAPESSGSLILGRVVHKDTKLPAKDLNVAISISGENFFFRVATSNIQGNFRFSLDPDYDSDNAIIQVVGSTKENYEVELYNEDSTDYNNLSFESFKITPAMKPTYFRT